MAAYDATETHKIAVTTSALAATFPGGIKACYLVSDADCFVDFDVPAIASDSLLIKASLQPVEINFGGGNVKKVYAITATGTANLYILGIRG